MCQIKISQNAFSRERKPSKQIVWRTRFAPVHERGKRTNVKDNFFLHLKRVSVSQSNQRNQIIILLLCVSSSAFCFSVRFWSPYYLVVVLACSVGPSDNEAPIWILKVAGVQTKLKLGLPLVSSDHFVPLWKASQLCAFPWTLVVINREVDH